jgi:hypothetical protein
MYSVDPDRLTAIAHQAGISPVEARKYCVEAGTMRGEEDPARWQAFLNEAPAGEVGMWLEVFVTLGRPSRRKISDSWAARNSW